MKHISTKTTYLEMRAPPTAAPVAQKCNAVIERVEQPDIAYYRFLYNSVGREYGWVDRNLLADDALRTIVQDERVEVYVLQLAEETAGFAELDRRQPAEIELAYFGLFPAFLGRGLGKFLLQWVVDRAWSYQPRRLWVHTCDLDHPAALPNYLKAGFIIYDEKWVRQIVVD